MILNQNNENINFKYKGIMVTCLTTLRLDSNYIPDISELEKVQIVKI